MLISLIALVALCAGGGVAPGKQLLFLLSTFIIIKIIAYMYQLHLILIVAFVYIILFTYDIYAVKFC